MMTFKKSCARLAAYDKMVDIEKARRDAEDKARWQAAMRARLRVDFETGRKGPPVPTRTEMTLAEKAEEAGIKMMSILAAGRDMTIEEWIIDTERNIERAGKYLKAESCSACLAENGQCHSCKLYE